MKITDRMQISSINIKNIIFDWGNVITNIDFNASIAEFKKLGIENFDSQYSLLKQSNLFVDLEKGNITPAFFRSEIKKMSNLHISDEDIDKAWNAMLLDLPLEIWKLLSKLKNCYKTYLLSNTNALHVQWYFKQIEKIYGTYGYTHLFEKIYFSHELNMRKPDREIYEFVLKDANIKPEETLFIDDCHVNILAAKKLGIISYQLVKPETLINLFENVQN